MSEEESYDLIFPRNREGRTEIKSLSEIRRVMPTIIVGDEFVGVSPMVGPTPETWELIRSLSKKDKQ
jgi:hypothetical protein